MSLSYLEPENVDEYLSDSDNNVASDPDNDAELSYYESLMKGLEFYLGEDVGLEQLRATCMAANLSGTYLVTGSRDGTLRCINFDKWAKGGFGDYWKVKLHQSVNSIAFNVEESVVAAASGNFLHFYTDGGDHIVSTTKGDMYLLDAKKTKGHTATVTAVANDPKNSNLFASGSMDGTVRLFDIQSTRENVSLSVNNTHIYTLSNKYLAKAKSANTGQAKFGRNRIGITHLCYSNCNYKEVLVAANELGSLVVWDYKTTFQSMMIEAYQRPLDTLISYEDNKLLTKSENLVRFWDLRQAQKPVRELELPPYPDDFNEGQNLVVSPDNVHLLINTCRKVEGEEPVLSSVLWVYDLEKSQVVNKMELESQLGPLVWTYETNQVFGFCSNGQIYSRCTTDPVGANHRHKAKQALEKKNKYSKVTTFSAKPEAYPIDYLPNDLIEVEDGVLKRKRPDTQDKYGIPKQEQDYFKHVKTQLAFDDEDIVTKLRSQVEKDTTRELSQGEGIGQVPYRADKFMAIYKKTQPNLILDFNKPATEGEKKLLGVSKCPRCGLKVCQCGYMDKNA